MNKRDLKKLKIGSKLIARKLRPGEYEVLKIITKDSYDELDTDRIPFPLLLCKTPNGGEQEITHKHFKFAGE